jgi:hypothetical protein
MCVRRYNTWQLPYNKAPMADNKTNNFSLMQKFVSRKLYIQQVSAVSIPQLISTSFCSKINSNLLEGSMSLYMQSTLQRRITIELVPQLLEGPANGF